VAVGPENGSVPEELIAAADALLYEAKRGGKNRIVAQK
jgi:PleD family two-component response regulator